MDDFSERLGNVHWAMVKELGIAGMVRLIWGLLRQPAVARRLMEWDEVFKEGKGIIGYGYFVARKIR
jgi:hypothetical protein